MTTPLLHQISSVREVLRDTDQKIEQAKKDRDSDTVEWLSDTRMGLVDAIETLEQVLGTITFFSTHIPRR